MSTTDETNELDEKHPSYLERLPDWEQMADTYAGARAVKARGEAYLPKTAGMIANGPEIGGKQYAAYVMRAVFHDVVQQAIDGLVGLIHRKDATITVPPPLQPFVDSATAEGAPLQLLWQRVTFEQLLRGRLGLLLDVPDGVSTNEAVPYVALYEAPAIPNWRTRMRGGRAELDLVVLNEDHHAMNERMAWEFVRQRRVVRLSEAGTYEAAVVTGAGGLEDASFVEPRRGATTLPALPFVFVNVVDVVPEVAQPPLLGLSDLALALYRGEADYRQSLYKQGQDTLVVIGDHDKADVSVGAGVVHYLPAGGDAKYVGVNPAGIGEQRQAIAADKAQAARFVVQLLDAHGDQAESGEALRVRVSARTASLVRIQRAAEEAMRRILRWAGMWLGLAPASLAEIVVEGNYDFSDAAVGPDKVSLLMDAKVKGAPLSMRSIHAWLAQHEYTTLSFDDEVQQIAEEHAELGGDGGTGVDIDPAQPPVVQ